MKIEVNGDSIRLTGESTQKAIRIYYTKEEGSDIFMFSVCEDGFEKGVLPMVTFYKDNTVVRSNLPQGKSFVG